MLSNIKRIILTILLCAIVMNLGGCLLREKAESEKESAQAEINHMTSAFTITVSETDDCHVLSLTAIEETPNGLLQEESKYLFSQGTKNGNEVMFSCEGLAGNGNSKYKLLLSLNDSDSRFLCTYTFQNVSLTDNAHIDLSNILHGYITISANHEDKTYTGFISVIS